MMTTIEPRELNCPVCATTFAAQVLTSTNTLGMRTTDLRTLAAGFQPQEFIVHTCPTCGYSGESDQFLSVGHVVPSVRIDAEMTARIRSSITPLVQRGKIDAARRWELAAWVTEWSGAPDEGWADETLVDELEQVHGSDFEVVDPSSLMIGPDSGQARQVNASLPAASYLPLARR